MRVEFPLVPFIVVVQTHLRGSLVHPQLSQAERPAANPTPTDKPYFFAVFPAWGLARYQLITARGIPVALMIAQPCLLSSPSLFILPSALYRLGTKKKLNLIKAKHDSKGALALPTCHRNKSPAYPLSSCPAGAKPGHEKQLK